MPYKKLDPRLIKSAVVSTNKYRKALKERAVEYKGGKCSKCGYCACMQALQFHHLDPSEKDFSISEDGFNRNWELVKLELDKCIIVCANCHAEIHETIFLEKAKLRELELEKLKSAARLSNNRGSVIKQCSSCKKEIRIFNSNVAEHNFCDLRCKKDFFNYDGWISDTELIELRKSLSVKEIAIKLNKNWKTIYARLNKIRNMGP